MGKAALRKRDQREAGPLPARFDFGPQFLARTTTQEPEEADQETPLRLTGSAS